MGARKFKLPFTEFYMRLEIDLLANLCVCVYVSQDMMTIFG